MLKNIFKIFSGTLVSRIMGFLRELFVANYFGTSKIADAYTFALTFPNIFRQILGEDMVERAFMPPFKTIYDKGEKERSWKFLSTIFNWFFVILLIVTFLLYFVIPILFTYFPENISTNSGFDFDLALKLIFILLPFMIFIGLAAFVGSLLNFFERNWIFGFAPVMLSVGVIIGLLTLKPFIGEYSLAVGWVLGALMQLLIQLPFIFSKKFKKETKFKYSLTFSDREENYTSLKKESKIITLNSIFNKSSELVTRFLATTLLQGATSSLYYSQRLLQLPIGIISLSIARGIIPELNRLKNVDDKNNFSKNYDKGILLYVMIMIPVTAIMIVASPEIVDIIFRRGEFDENSLMLTSGALKMYSLGILPMSFMAYYTRLLSLFKLNKYALNVSIIGALSNIILALTLIEFTELSHLGIALASSFSFTLNMILLKKYVEKELRNWTTTLEVSHKKLTITLIFVSTLLIISVSYFDLYHFSSKLVSITSLMIKSIVTIGIFAGIFMIFSQTREIMGKLRRNK